MLCYNIVNLISIAVYSWYSKQNLLCVELENLLTRLNIGVNSCLCVCVCIYKPPGALGYVMVLYGWNQLAANLKMLFISNCSCCSEMFFPSRWGRAMFQCWLHITPWDWCWRQSLPWCAPHGRNSHLSCSRHGVVLESVRHGQAQPKLFACELNVLS